MIAPWSKCKHLWKTPEGSKHKHCSRCGRVDTLTLEEVRADNPLYPLGDKEMLGFSGILAGGPFRVWNESLKRWIEIPEEKK